jgi:hypothetical protein
MGLNRINPADQERVLAGSAPSGELDELAAFATAIRTSLVAQPPPAASIAPRLAEAARVGLAQAPTEPRGSAAPRRRIRRRALAARVAFAVALVPALTAGLAYAGVNLPDAVDDAFESAGVDLPNQDRDEPASDAGRPDAADDATPGEAGSPAGPGAQDGPGKRGRGKARGHDKQKAQGKAVGHGGTPPGQANKPASPPGQQNRPAAPPGQANRPSEPPGQAKKPPGFDPPGQAKTPGPPPDSNAGGNGK